MLHHTWNRIMQLSAWTLILDTHPIESLETVFLDGDHKFIFRHECITSLNEEYPGISLAVHIPILQWPSYSPDWKL